MVRIQLCGRFAVVVDGQPAESRLPGRQGRLLVAYLATYRAQPVERTVLLDVLWPDGGAGAASALTVLLSKARALLAPAEIRGRRFLAEYEAIWIDEWRRQLDVNYERALACYGEACLGIGGTELPAAERAARRLAAHAPLAETGHRLLMRALTARGDPAAALAAYDQLRQLLREEPGVSPCPATQALHARLLRGQPLDEPARPATHAR